MSYIEMDKKAYIFGSLFVLPNRLQVLGDKVDTNVTMKQWMLIAVLSKSENLSLTIGELARTVGTSHQNTKKMAVLLQKQGFLALNKHPSDARATVVTLTEYCADYFKKRNDIEELFLQKVFQDFDDSTIKGLYNGLCQLQHNIECMESLSHTDKNIGDNNYE